MIWRCRFRISRSFVSASNIPLFEKEGVEADDIIASASQTALRSKGFMLSSYSADKDLMQLVGDQVVMWDPMRDKIFDSEEVHKKYNVGPESLLDLFALSVTVQTMFRVFQDRSENCGKTNKRVWLSGCDSMQILIP